jgi:hypothetical protein
MRSANSCLRILASSPQIASASSVYDTISKGLESCPSDIYVIVSQPGVSSMDYQSSDATSYLRKFVSGENKHIRSSFTVSEVLGAIDTSALASALEKRCGAGLLSVDASSEWPIATIDVFLITGVHADADRVSYSWRI